MRDLFTNLNWSLTAAWFTPPRLVLVFVTALLVVLLSGPFARSEDAKRPGRLSDSIEAHRTIKPRLPKFSGAGFLNQRVPPLRLMGAPVRKNESGIATGAISRGLDPRRPAQPRIGLYENTPLSVPPAPTSGRPTMRDSSLSPRLEALRRDEELGAILAKEAQGVEVAAASSKKKSKRDLELEKKRAAGRGAKIPKRFGKKKAAAKKSSKAKKKSKAKKGKNEKAQKSPLAGATPAQQYCFNTADSAADARFAWQAKKIREMEAELDKRVAFLQKRTEEYKSWLAKRDTFSRKAQEKLVGFYAKMQPDAAAAQLTVMDEMMAAAILMKLKPKVASLVMGEIPAEKAAKLAAIISGAAKVPPRRSKRSPGRNERKPANNRANRAAPPA